MERNYFEFKNEIKEKILSAYGTYSNFLALNPKANLTPSKLSLILNPSSNTRIDRLVHLCNVLGIQLTTVGMPKKVA